ncbi:hypothetical protein P8452_64773 [Trifolium repens]|nr:hypothetical protein P8452_64771 [Trifolium repens]WJX81953.1 hypothetical protein P8452_64773 [Trifolium repens]
MDQTLKFAYFVILFVSLFIIVAVGHKECDTDDDCYKKYTNSIPGILKCLDGYCVSPINPQVPDKIE